MWTADADTYSRTFVEMLDWHMKLAEETAGNSRNTRTGLTPTEASGCGGTTSRGKLRAEFARLTMRIKHGTISSPLNHLVLTYGGQPVEAVLRGMSYPGSLERRYNMRFPLVTTMESRTVPLGLTSLFAGSGAQYSWRGVAHVPG